MSYPADIRQRAAALRDEGHSAREVAERLGVSRAIVLFWAKAEGASFTGRRGRPSKTAPHEARIAALYADGRTLAEIAAEIGCTKSTVGDALRRLGVPRRTAWDYDRSEVVHQRPDAAKDALVLKMRREGKTFPEIGAVLGVSHQRAAQRYARAAASEAA